MGTCGTSHGLQAVAVDEKQSRAPHGHIAMFPFSPSSDHLAWLEWHWHRRHQRVIMTLAVLWYPLNCAHRIAWGTAFDTSEALAGMLNALSPAVWLAVFWSWWVLRREHREGREQDLWLSSVNSHHLFWSKVFPIGAMYVLAFAVSLAVYVLRFRLPAPFGSVGTERFLQFYPQRLYQLLFIGIAAPIFVAAWMVVVPRSAASRTCIVVPSVALSALSSLAWPVSLLIYIHLSYHFQWPSMSPFGIVWPRVFHVLIQGVPTALIAVYVIPRFKRIYSTG